MPISAALGSSALLPAGLGFRNAIINGDFRINQRGFTSVTTGATYGFDRWRVLLSGGTVTYSPQTFTVGNAIQGQEPKNFARLVTSGQSAAGDLGILEQPIEGVRTFAGQTITISFWAKAGSGTPKVAVEIIQNFGIGGSPSAVVNNYVGQVTLSTSWARYFLTFNVPSISGKTIGTADDMLNLYLWVSGGSNWNSRNGSLGIQNGTFDFWGVQVEQNYQPTPFEQRPIGIELALCQRYYYRVNGPSSAIYTSAGTTGVVGGPTAANRCGIVLPVPMRRTIVTGDFSYSSIAVYDQSVIPAVTSLAGINHLDGTHLTIDYVASAGGLTAGRAVVPLLYNVGSFYAINAEL